MNYANTLLIRSGATRFAAAGQEISDQEKKLANITESLDAGSDGWRGEGARAFYAETEKHRADFRLASQAFLLVAQALNTLANQLDTVNQMRRQLENLQHESSVLQRRLLHAEDEDRSYYNQEIGLLNVRITQLRFEADSLERNANLVAGRQFDDAADMAERLHSFYDSGSSFDLGAVLFGTSKVIGHSGAGIDTKDILKRKREGFTVQRVVREVGYDVLIKNGSIDNIADGVYHSSDMKKYPNVFKYTNGLTNVKETVTNLKSIATWLGYASIAFEMWDHLQENISDQKDSSYVAAELSVDFAIGIGTVAASAWAAGQTGALLGVSAGPAGIAICAGVGVIGGVLSSVFFDGIILNGKPINEHIKEEVADIYAEVGIWADSAVASISNIWGDEDE